MFANGGSVYIPPALRYMAQNPDVFNASTANARARGLSGKNMQGQIERDAALHYAFHGQGEGRQYGGRTFLGGLLEPRLGDTFGLSPERKQELENERDGIDNLPVAAKEPAEGLVGLVPIDNIEAGQGDGGGKAKGGLVSLAEGGEVYESSPVVQGYLQSNADVLNHSVRVAQSQGVAPGLGFQRAVENAAREHWNTYGKNEGRSISGYGDEGASLMTTDSERMAISPPTEREGIFANPVNPQMLAIAELLKGTRRVYNEPEDLYSTAFFGTNPQGGYYEPEYLQTTRQIDDILGRINPVYRRGIIGATSGDSNEDMVAREMDNALKGLFVRRGHLGEIPSIYDRAGGTPELTRALGELGGYDIDPTGRMSSGTYGQNMQYKTIGGRPISLADVSEANILRDINSRFNSGSSREPYEEDDIGPGGATFVRYDDTAQINPEAGSILPDGSMAPALIPGTGNPVEFQTGFGSLGEVLDQLPEIAEQFEPIGALFGGAGTINAGITASRGTDLNPAFGTNPFNQDQSMALSGTNILTQMIDPLPNNMNQYGLGGFSGFAPFGDQSPQEGYTTLGEFDRSLVG
jgi:hypothetical protein